jgi:hypothetical protein
MFTAWEPTADQGDQLEVTRWLDLDNLFQKVPESTFIQSTADSGDHFEDTACVPVTISNPNFNWLWVCSILRIHQSNAIEGDWTVSD